MSRHMDQDFLEKITDDSLSESKKLELIRETTPVTITMTEAEWGSLTAAMIAGLATGAVLDIAMPTFELFVEKLSQAMDEANQDGPSL